MNSRTLLAAAAAAVLTTTLAPAAPAGAVVSWTYTDQADDVKLGSTSAGLTKAQRRSIDLRSVKALTVEGGATRVTVKIRAVRPALAEDQIIFFDTRPLPGRGAYPQLRAGWSVQQPELGFATLYTSPDEYVNCDPLPTTTSGAGTDTIRQVIPSECLPAGKQRVHVQSYIGPFRSEGVDVASDSMRFRTKVR